jgi:hypothetical protein
MAARTVAIQSPDVDSRRLFIGIPNAAISLDLPALDRVVVVVRAGGIL